MARQLFTVDFSEPITNPDLATAILQEVAKSKLLGLQLDQERPVGRVWFTNNHRVTDKKGRFYHAEVTWQQDEAVITGLTITPTMNSAIHGLSPDAYKRLQEDIQSGIIDRKVIDRVKNYFG